jgi:hypothetical protein
MKLLRAISLLGVTLSLVMLGSGCSSKKSLDRSQAGKLIREKTDFFAGPTANVAIGSFCGFGPIDEIRISARDERMFTGGYIYNDPAAPFLLSASLEPQGLVTLAAAPNFKCSDLFHRGYEVALTPQGKSALQQWPSQQQTDGSILFKPLLLTSDLDDVTGIAPGADGTTATAEFTYHFKNTDAFSILKVLHRVPEQPRRASATLRLYDDGWRVTDIKNLETP